MANLQDIAWESKAWPFEEAKKLVKRFENKKPESGYAIKQFNFWRRGFQVKFTSAVYQFRFTPIPFTQSGTIGDGSNIGSKIHELLYAKVLMRQNYHRHILQANCRCLCDIPIDLPLRS